MSCLWKLERMLMWDSHQLPGNILQNTICQGFWSSVGFYRTNDSQYKLSLKWAYKQQYEIEVLQWELPWLKTVLWKSRLSVLKYHSFTVCLAIVSALQMTPLTTIVVLILFAVYWLKLLAVVCLCKKVLIVFNV